MSKSQHIFPLYSSLLLYFLHKSIFSSVIYTIINLQFILLTQKKIPFIFIFDRFVILKIEKINKFIIVHLLYFFNYIINKDELGIIYSCKVLEDQIQ